MKPSFDLCLQEHEVECMRYNYIHDDEITVTASVKKLAIKYKNEKLKL